MENLQLLFHGFQSAVSLANLLSAVLGALLGTIVGVLPGLGPAATLALLIPVAFSMRPDTALIMMTAVYAGSMYGGSLTSVLLRVPGEAASVMTSLDGFEMAKQGRAGSALAIAAIGSWIGGVLAVVGIIFLAPPLAEFALKFGPTEYFAVMLAALMLSAAMMGQSIVKSAMAICLGLMISTVGTDLQTGVPRFTLGVTELLDGIEFLSVIVGIFGVGEVLWYFREVRQGGASAERLALKGRLWPSKQEFKDSSGPIARGTVIGFLAGVLPGAGPIMASVISYMTEKRISRHPERFGQGAIEGVAAAETSNNAASAGAMIPMLTLGIPATGTTAVMLGALMMWGIRPGPMLFTEQADLVWTVIASMVISNVILLILNLPMIGMFVKILDISPKFLMPAILTLAVVGAFATNNSMIDVYLVILFGVVGYFMRLMGLPPAALVLALVLGDRFEQSLRQAMQLSRGNPLVFLTSPISAVALAVGVAAVVWDATKGYRSRRKAAPGQAA